MQLLYKRDGKTRHILAPGVRWLLEAITDENNPREILEPIFIVINMIVKTVWYYSKKIQSN